MKSLFSRMVGLSLVIGAFFASAQPSKADCTAAYQSDRSLPKKERLRIQGLIEDASNPLGLSIMLLYSHDVIEYAFERGFSGSMKLPGLLVIVDEVQKEFPTAHPIDVAHVFRNQNLADAYCPSSSKLFNWSDIAARVIEGYKLIPVEQRKKF